MYEPGSIHPSSLLLGGDGGGDGDDGDDGVEDCLDALLDVYGEARLEVANAVRGRRGTREKMMEARVVGTLEKRGYYGTGKEWRRRFDGGRLADGFVADVMPR